MTDFQRWCVRWNVWVDMLWLTLAAKMLNTNLRIYFPRWKKTGPMTKCIGPIKPLDVFNVPLSSIDNGPTLKVIRVTSAVSSNAHYNLLLDAEEAFSSITRMVSHRRANRMIPGLLGPAKEMKFSRLWKHADERCWLIDCKVDRVEGGQSEEQIWKSVKLYWSKCACRLPCFLFILFFSFLFLQAIQNFAVCCLLFAVCWLCCVMILSREAKSKL